MATYGLSDQTVTFTVTEDYLAPVSVPNQSTNISTTASGVQYSYTMPSQSNGRNLVYTNNNAASVSGNTVYFNSRGETTSFTVYVYAAYANVSMSSYGLSSVLISITVSESYTAPYVPPPEVHQLYHFASIGLDKFPEFYLIRRSVYLLPSQKSGYPVQFTTANSQTEQFYKWMPVFIPGHDWDDTYPTRYPEWFEN
jgi:hypothetical protein